MARTHSSSTSSSTADATADRTGSTPDIQAAGVVVFRPGREVLLVHRPKYDDWSFPKGKLERWEHRVAAAVREVAEETGLHVRLGPPLAAQRYPTGRRMKTVHYWTGRVVGDDDVSLYRPNAEIDRVAWVSLDKAQAQLTYPYDRETLAEAVALRRKTHAVVVLRHAVARSRKAWRGEDRLRPLLKAGEVDSDRLVPILAAYDVSRVITSTSRRCVQTVTPYVATTGYDLDGRGGLAEEDATHERINDLVDEIVAKGQGAVLCTHRPVLPAVLDALGVRKSQRGPALEPAEMLVVHLRKGTIVAVERHQA